MTPSDMTSRNMTDDWTPRMMILATRIQYIRQHDTRRLNILEQYDTQQHYTQRHDILQHDRGLDTKHHESSNKSALYPAT
jgi:hypothetical protein